MTKDEAREILNNYVTSITFTGLPISDVNLVHISSNPISNFNSWDTTTHFQTYSFKGLLKIAYDL